MCKFFHTKVGRLLMHSTFTGLKTAFDEKTLFPRYILDYEAKMKSYHQVILKEQQVCLHYMCSE